MTTSTSARNIDKTPKNDILFKILFGNPKHPRLLIALLNAVLNLDAPITGVTITQTELTPETIGKKGVRLDILAKTSDKKIINIEIQKKDEHNMLERSLFNWSRIFSGQAEVSEEYINLKKTICINILAFKLFNDGRYWHKGFLTDPKTHERLTDLLEIHFLELKKIKKRKPDSPIMFWLEFIDNPESERIKKMYELEAVFSEAKEVYDKAIADPSVQELLRIHDKAERDYNDAIARNRREGEQVGGHQKAVDVAQNLLKIKLPLPQIAQITGLSIEEVEKIKNSN